MTAAAQNAVTVAQERAPAPTTPMDLLNQAVASGNLDLAEKMMGLQERWEKNQSRKAFDAAIASAKAEIPPIVRNTTGHNSKRYADFAAIARVVDPIISKHGLSYRFRTKQSERIEVTCVLSHRDGHFEETTLAGPPDKTGSKNDIQAIGSTLTYLQRYSLVQALGLAASNDDDGKAGNAGEKLSEEQVTQIIDLLEAKGAPRAKFLKWARVDTVEDILAGHFQSCIDAINNFKA